MRQLKQSLVNCTSRQGRRLLSIVLLAFCSLSLSNHSMGNTPTSSTEADTLDCVILLHGLARSHRSMAPIEDALIDEGYFVVNSEYNSLEAPIEVLAPRAINEAVEQCPEESRATHFVTHSLGGILVRQYFESEDAPASSRVIMLGPPNQGSELVDNFVKVPGFNKLNGFAGQQLGTDEKSKPITLTEPNFEFGVIAGSKSINPILSLLLPGKDDGKVTIESTKLEGMKAHITLPTTHTFMMRNPQVIEQITYFLKEGKFDQH